MKNQVHIIEIINKLHQKRGEHLNFSQGSWMGQFSRNSCPCLEGSIWVGLASKPNISTRWQLLGVYLLLRSVFRGLTHQVRDKLPEDPKVKVKERVLNMSNQDDLFNQPRGPRPGWGPWVIVSSPSQEASKYRLNFHLPWDISQESKHKTELAESSESPPSPESLDCPPYSAPADAEMFLCRAKDMGLRRKGSMNMDLSSTAYYLCVVGNDTCPLWTGFCICKMRVILPTMTRSPNLIQTGELRNIQAVEEISSRRMLTVIVRGGERGWEILGGLSGPGFAPGALPKLSHQPTRKSRKERSSPLPFWGSK